MYRKLAVLGFMLSGSAASAQFITAGPSGPAGVSLGVPGGVSTANPGALAPQSPDYAFGGDITPTMRRERQARAAMVRAIYPDIAADMARRGVNGGQMVYARAEKQARWARIAARERND